MNNPVELAQRYLAVWNEADGANRRTLIEAAFSEDATYLDPLMHGEGHDGIDAMIAAAQSQFSNHRFTLAGDPDGHHEVIRFSWTFGLPGATPMARGTDVASIAGGRFDKVVGFLDTARFAT